MPTNPQNRMIAPSRLQKLLEETNLKTFMAWAPATCLIENILNS